MKYKDYYRILGVEKTASEEDIKKAYRKLARQYHPDVSKEAGAEARFKEIGEAYQTLRDTEKRAAYDQLGSYTPGQDFRPGQEWQRQHADSNFSFDNIDLSDLFSGLNTGRYRNSRHENRMQMAGQDYEVSVHLSIEEAYSGKEVKLDLQMPEYDQNRQVRKVSNTFTARIPKGVTDGYRLCVKGKGGKGINGGPNGDLYLIITIHPHPLFRVNGHNLDLDVPLTPWEAALGTTIQIPTPGGTVSLKVPAGAQAEQRLRLGGRGLPLPGGGSGDLFATLKIVMPRIINDKERELFKQLAVASSFNPRGHFQEELRRESFKK